MSEFEAAIFDLDGTLIDSMYVWQKVDVDFLTQRGIPLTQDYTEKMRGMYFEDAARYTIKTYGLHETVEQIIQIWLNMARYEYEHNVRIKPFVKEYLEELRGKNFRLGVATSSNPYLLEPVLRNNGLESMFDAVCYTSQVGKNKSEPDIYLYTARLLGVDPGKCVVFEDIPEGINGANKAGMYTVAVFDKSSEDQAVNLAECADRYIRDYSELLGEELWKETD